MSATTVLRDSDYPALKQLVLDHTGLSYYADKDGDFAVRVSRRMAARGLTLTGEYLSLLSRDLMEMDCLVGELTIGETFFFRQGDQFEALRSTILPDLIERNRDSRTLRIWSAGCANGAEPYSIAILLGLEWEVALTGWDVSILATDINVEFLKQAREGVFREWALRETSPEIRARCFQQHGKRWTLLPEFRKRVTFRYHNLAAAAPPISHAPPFDLILCRNVLIYFSAEAMREVSARLYALVAPGGWLMVGHAEPNAEIFAQFEAFTRPACAAYRKPGKTTPAESAWTLPPIVAPSPVRPPAALRVAAAPVQVQTSAPSLAPFNVDDIRLLADSGRWKAALTEVDKFIQRNPLDAPAQFTRGLILEHAGAHEDAQLALRRAIYLDRGFALAHYHLGASLQASGDAASARRSFATVVRLLVGIAPAEPIPHGDGITAEELSELAKMHLDLIPE